MRSAFADAGGVLVTAVRLIWRHWPVLVVLYLAGRLVRELVLRGAVEATSLDSTAGLLVFVLAPVATLTALVLMLRVVRSSLPSLRAATEAPVDGAPSRLINHLGSVLVPFVAAYYAYDYLREDVTDYHYRIFLAFGGIFSGDSLGEYTSRLPFNSTSVVVVLVVVALVLRSLLGWWDGTRRRWWLGVTAAYVEVIWVIASAGFLVGMHSRVGDWLGGRRVVHWAGSSWHEALGLLGPFTGLATRASDWFFGLSGIVDDVIVVPVAFLIVAAVVYGHSVAPEGTAEAMVRGGGRVPRALRQVGAMARRDMRGRFGPLIEGVRLIARAGLVPMLLFCLTFFVTRTIEAWLWEAERFLIGPRELTSVWMPLSGLLNLFNSMVGTVLLVCLLGAAVDRVLRSPRPSPAPAPPTSPDIAAITAEQPQLEVSRA